MISAASICRDDYDQDDYKIARCKHKFTPNTEITTRKFVGGGRRNVWPPWPDSRGQTFRAPYIRCGTTEVSNMT
jgi:hypothetical protein